MTIDEMQKCLLEHKAFLDQHTARLEGVEKGLRESSNMLIEHEGLLKSQEAHAAILDAEVAPVVRVSAAWGMVKKGTGSFFGALKPLAMPVFSAIMGACLMLGGVQKGCVPINPNPAPVNPDVPTDPFTMSVQAAYAADGKPADQAAKLAAVYRASGATVNNAAFTSSKQILDTMHAAVEAILPLPALKNTRTAIADELDKTLKTPATLTPALRVAITAQFARVQIALETCK